MRSIQPYADIFEPIGHPHPLMRDKKLPTVIFGEVLQELRLGQALTQDKLAALADTERSHISAPERAEKGPALATIFSLATALGMPAGDLIAMVETRLRSAAK